ncbi:MAG TPA: PilN domain-containing protein [Thermoanaerobaculaceae bacterium]|nr:PilN domain-containing protein [Thermoanaerobaculaceae bacterium]HRS15644.1 PilN domain-containing protein [Thermoanaerobaculaceae bacterium]
MIKVNLLVEARAEKATRQPLISIGSLSGANVNNYIILGLLLVGLAVVGYRYYQLDSKRKEIRAEIAVNQKEFERLKPIIDEVEEFKKKNAELKRKIEVIEKLKQDQQGPVRIMDEVSKALPDLLWLDSLNLSGNTITIRGQALNENAVANFISNLGSSPFFQEPALNIMRQDAKGVFTFDLACTFSYAPRQASETPKGQ